MHLCSFCATAFPGISTKGLGHVFSFGGAVKALEAFDMFTSGLVHFALAIPQMVHSLHLRET